MPSPLAYLNGRLLPEADFRLSPHDAGFVMGATVTDLCRTFHHRLYRWPDHLARFGRSCLATGINPPVAEEDLTRAAEQLVEHNAALLAPEQDLAVVVFATPGPVPGRVSPEGDAGPTVGMHTYPLPFARYRRWFAQGAVLLTPTVRQVPASCVDPHIKQRSRMHWWLAQQEVQRTDPDALALLCDDAGRVCETYAANFLIARAGTVLSPPRDSILEGVSLCVVEELCRDLGIPFAEQTLSVHDSVTADEAMLCSTGFCLVGVSRLNHTPLPWPGPIFVRLLAEWGRRVGVAIDRQILAGP
jgi:branched-subunit amino acid aminotransferase/4-amino-4-deoxychorismate lyase